MEEFLTYEQFGAIGDGVADDMPAIVRTHAEANRLGLPVRAREPMAKSRRIDPTTLKTSSQMRTKKPNRNRLRTRSFTRGLRCSR